MLNIRKFIFNSFAENTYVVYDSSGEAMVVDPGISSPDEEKMFKDFITKNNLTIRYLVNTHCHIDHITGNRFVADTFKVVLSAHRGEILNLQLADQQADLFGLPRPDTPVIGHFLEDGEVIRLGKGELVVIHTPGHTSGGISLYAKEDKFVICGDLLFRGSIGRVDLPGGDYDTILKSIATRIFTLPEDITVYAGHGEETTVGFEKKYNPFFN